jgi:hypothetical protein
VVERERKFNSVASKYFKIVVRKICIINTSEWGKLSQNVLFPGLKWKDDTILDGSCEERKYNVNCMGSD